tara:strand:- start:483 stop:629 length:147 start_codon:yes stop_codon:yes gene_type:complete
MNDIGAGDDLEVNFEEGNIQAEAFNHYTQAMDNHPASMFRHTGPLNSF